MSRRIYSEHKDKWCDLYSKGYSLRMIGEKYGVSKSTVKSYIRDSIEIRPKSSAYLHKKEIIEMFKKGMSYGVIADKFSSSDNTIRKILIENGYDVGEKKSRLSKDKDEIIALYNDGVSAIKISKMYGTNPQTVTDFLRQSNVKIKTYSEYSRKNYIDDDYFNVLTPLKVYEIGLLFAIGRPQSAVNTFFLDLTAKSCNKDIITKAHKNFCDKTPVDYREWQQPSISSVRINSTQIYDKMIEYGMDGDVFNIPKKYIDKFFEGYFEYRLKIRDDSLYIGFRRYEEPIYDYLLNTIGVDLDKLRLCRSGVIVERKTEVLKIVKHCPYLIDRLRKAKTTRWDNFLMRYID